MNPRLIKLAVELQNGERIEKNDKNIYFNNGGGGHRFFNILKAAKVTVPVDKNH